MTRIGDIGTVNVIESSDPIAYYVSLALIKTSKLNSFFLKFSIQSDIVQKELWKKTLHVAFPKKINKNEISNIIIKIPILKEQEKIGSLFQTLDALIASNQLQQKDVFWA